MATNLAVKRMTRERAALEKVNDDFFAHFEDDNVLRFEAYVYGPPDTLYAHKFVKIRFEIPDQYPLIPPKCTFIQYGGERIHPNLYVEGKVCLSILGTWEGEPWALAMTCETVLITIRSLLDNSPYKHEPGQRDHQPFNDYVQHNTWRWLLLDYLRKESEPSMKARLGSYVRDHGEEMLEELQNQQKKFEAQNVRQLSSPYSRRTSHVPNFRALRNDLLKLINDCKTNQTTENQEQVDPVTETGRDEVEENTKTIVPKKTLPPQTDGAYECDVQIVDALPSTVSAYSNGYPSTYPSWPSGPYSVAYPPTLVNTSTANPTGTFLNPLSQASMNAFATPTTQMSTVVPHYTLPSQNFNSVSTTQLPTPAPKKENKVVIDLT